MRLSTALLTGSGPDTETQAPGNVSGDRASLQANPAKSDMAVGTQEIEGTPGNPRTREFHAVGRIIGDHVDAQQLAQAERLFGRRSLPRILPAHDQVEPPVVKPLEHSTEKLPYAHNRYQFEARRHYGILDARLAKRRYMVADMYSIVDMDVWGWARLIPFILGDGAWDSFPNLKRLIDEIGARPAAARAVALKDKHKFKAEMDDEARAHMFKHLAMSVA